MQINGNMVVEELASREVMKASVKLLQAIKEDISNMLDEKIKEMQKIAERKELCKNKFTFLSIYLAHFLGFIT